MRAPPAARRLSRQIAVDALAAALRDLGDVRRGIGTVTVIEDVHPDAFGEPLPSLVHLRLAELGAMGWRIEERDRVAREDGDGPADLVVRLIYRNGEAISLSVRSDALDVRT